MLREIFLMSKPRMFTGIDGLNKKILKVCVSELTKYLLFTSSTTPSEGWYFCDKFEIAKGSSTLSQWWEIVVRSRFYQMFLNSLCQSYILCDQLLYCLKAKMAFWGIRNIWFHEISINEMGIIDFVKDCIDAVEVVLKLW